MLIISSGSLSGRRQRKSKKLKFGYRLGCEFPNFVRFFEAMIRFDRTDTNLLPNESFITRCYNVKLSDDNSKNTKFEGGELIVTTMRLLWGISGVESSYMSVPLTSIILLEEDKSFFGKSKLALHLSRRDDIHSVIGIVKISFKEKLDADFLCALNEALVKAKKNKKETPPVASGIKQRAGIVGIERGIEAKQKAIDESISVAFQDLNKLMIMAKDMVNVSKNISNALKEKQAIGEDETVKFKSYLMGMGIDDPVTRDAYRTDVEYYTKLGMEINAILEEPVTSSGGLMLLTDAYCRVNRARGMELLSPEDFLSACQSMEKNVGIPMILKVFDSGVKILQLRTKSMEATVAVTQAMLEDKGSLTGEELARVLGEPIVLGKERLLAAEKAGKACRDDSVHGLKFYPNKFLFFRV